MIALVAIVALALLGYILYGISMRAPVDGTVAHDQNSLVGLGVIVLIALAVIVLGVLSKHGHL